MKVSWVLYLHAYVSPNSLVAFRIVNKSKDHGESAEIKLEVAVNNIRKKYRATISSKLIWFTSNNSSFNRV